MFAVVLEVAADVGGEPGLAGGGAVAGVGPVRDDEDGGVGVVVGVEQAEGCALLVGAVVGADLAECAKGGGVAAGLGGEVAAEAEQGRDG